MCYLILNFTDQVSLTFWSNLPFRLGAHERFFDGRYDNPLRRSMKKNARVPPALVGNTCA